MTKPSVAPGAPGAIPHWTSPAKTGVGTAIGTDSVLWFTLGQSVVTEVYYAFADTPCLRWMGFVVTDRHDFISDERHDVDSKVSYLVEGVPAFQVENRCRQRAIIAFAKRFLAIHAALRCCKRFNSRR